MLIFRLHPATVSRTTDANAALMPDCDLAELSRAYIHRLLHIYVHDWPCKLAAGTEYNEESSH